MKMKHFLLAGVLALAACQSPVELCEVTPGASDLEFPSLAQRWDEGIPLGNATIGALVWQNGDALRLSLDRTDLWDLRPLDSLSGDHYRFEWVKQHIRHRDYLPVQQKFDHPYDREAAPSKIPGAALEFPLAQLGTPVQVRLFLHNALCQAEWADGTTMQAFVHANEPVGWFIFKGLKTPIEPSLKTPVYQSDHTSGEASPVTGQSLERLGYEQGSVRHEGNCLVYHQKGYGDFYYDVAVRWQQDGETLTGTWSVTSSLTGEQAGQATAEALRRGLRHDYKEHARFWQDYWAQSSVCLPDTVLQKQYDNELYKFGSASREHSAPISLQAVWTADNGHLPPWKGDYHHDLNTQLSYWPAYTGNHLTEGLGYLNTLWNQRDTYRRFTRQYFGTDGMNVPGVCTLTGEPMGGWVQYSMSQTTGAWLAQHFYLHWKYSADRHFLEQRAWPFVRDVAIYLEQQSQVGADGVRQLEYSSSPEIFDNSLQAWFPTMTNYDLALMRFLFRAAAEMADELQLTAEAEHWKATERQLPPFDTDEEGCLTFAKGFPYDASHRHFSHAMAIHPLGLIDWSDGEDARRIIRSTLQRLKDCGPDWWCGYSYSWYANLQARAFNGDEAARSLCDFAQCFCLPNTFHVNGDQSGTGKSRFTYRPFTLEGNFAFAAGVQEMLLQSHTGVVRVFPAIPSDWQNVSFHQLRAMGGFLISAERKAGQLVRLEVFSEQGKPLRILLPGSDEALQLTPETGKWTTLIPKP